MAESSGFSLKSIFMGVALTTVVSLALGVPLFGGGEAIAADPTTIIDPTVTGAEATAEPIVDPHANCTHGPEGHGGHSIQDMWRRGPGN